MKYDGKSRPMRTQEHLDKIIIGMQMKLERKIEKLVHKYRNKTKMDVKSIDIAWKGNGIASIKQQPEVTYED